MADTERRPFPQLNSFRSWVNDELNTRRRTWPTPTSAPFVRMTSCNEDLDLKYSYFSLGLHGFDNQDANIFESTYGTQRDIVGYAYRNGRKTLIGADEIKYIPPTLDSYASLKQDDPQRIAIDQRVQQAQTQQNEIAAKGAHPIPGITGISIHRNGLANPFIAEIHWQCYNQQQLEFLRNHFLIAGTYIVLEWGQKTSTQPTQPFKYLDFSDRDLVTQELLNSIIKGRKYVIDQYAKPNNGNYDFTVGQVGNFAIDFDATLNIYKCSTKLVSMGENVWGLNSVQTATVLTTDGSSNDPTAINRITDIHSYFEGAGSPYDRLLGQWAANSDTTKYVRPQQLPYNANASNAKETAFTGANPIDASFISWSAFTNDVMNDIIGMFSNLSGNADTNAMYDKLRTDLRTVLGLGGPPIKSNLPSDVYEEQKRLYDLEWIGNHPALRSTDPTVMILITSELAKNKPAADWLGSGIFGDSGTQSHQGKLSEGVWLNTDMIRECFLKTTTLQAAIQEILNHMNIAIGGYWQLRLFYDDEIAVYKIIDFKFDQETDTLPFYVFNSHQNDQHNETVAVKFDTAFPPELITQMMVISMIQTASPTEQKALFEKYPLINHTSPFMFAVNWTSLRDILKDKIHAQRGGTIVERGTEIKSIPIGTQPNQTDSVSGTARILDSQHGGSQMGASPIDAGQEGTKRTIPGAVMEITPQSADTSAPKPRPTALPPRIGTAPLTNHPIDPELITSDFGARNAPTKGASINHPGIDLSANVGTSVYAAAAGIIEIASFTNTGLGGQIKIKHNSGYETIYGHLSTILVTPGQHVEGGDIIAKSGGQPGTLGAGTSTGPHLHFEVRHYGLPEDPTTALAAIDKPPTEQEQQFAKALTSNVQTASDNTSGEATSSTTTPEQQETKNLQEYAKKFGNNILNLIIRPSVLRNTITSDGYKNLSNKLVNAFVSPFPTKTSVEVKIPGISGISISDGFTVDKLPFIFANYGVFQVTEVSDTVENTGWYTNVRGYFKMLWPAGTGGQRVD